MSEDDDGYSELDGGERGVADGYNTDLFGEYSVVSPGVHIVLDGRPVSRQFG